MAAWLLKTEPTVYSWEDLERDRRTVWDGVAPVAGGPAPLEQPSGAPDPPIPPARRE